MSLDKGFMKKILRRILDQILKPSGYEIIPLTEVFVVKGDLSEDVRGCLEKAIATGQMQRGHFDSRSLPDQLTLVSH